MTDHHMPDNPINERFECNCEWMDNTNEDNGNWDVDENMREMRVYIVGNWEIYPDSGLIANWNMNKHARIKHNTAPRWNNIEITKDKEVLVLKHALCG